MWNWYWLSACRWCYEISICVISAAMKDDVELKKFDIFTVAFYHWRGFYMALYWNIQGEVSSRQSRHRCLDEICSNVQQTPLKVFLCNDRKEARCPGFYFRTSKNKEISVQYARVCMHSLSRSRRNTHMTDGDSWLSILYLKLIPSNETAL